MYFGCCCKLKLALFIDYIIEIVIDHGVTFGENEVVCVCLLSAIAFRLSHWIHASFVMNRATLNEGGQYQNWKL